jgi:Domain of unknown function (DUF6089)
MKHCLHSVFWKCLCVSAITLCIISPAFAQEEARNTSEFGFTTGPMAYLGDLGGHIGKGTTFIKDYNINKTKASYGAFYEIYPSPWLGFRLQATYGNIGDCDCDIKEHGGDEDTRFNRNLDFQSIILEGTVMAEFYPTTFLEDDPEDVQGRLRPYGLIGLGLFHFNPQGSLQQGGNEVWYDLQPLHTEGEGWVPGSKEYSLTQLNIPMGFGVKYFLSEDISISAELIYRKLFTDYLDDVHSNYIDPSLFAQHLSPTEAALAVQLSNKSAEGYNTPSYEAGDKRGTPGNNDAYFTFGFKLGIRLTGGNKERWYNSTHCPLLRF